jgi:hypothetical protein
MTTHLTKLGQAVCEKPAAHQAYMRSLGSCPFCIEVWAEVGKFAQTMGDYHKAYKQWM